MELPTPHDIDVELARRHLIDFTLFTYPGYRAGWFHRELCGSLEWFLGEVLAERSPRLMIFAPPRHGKSEVASRRFPAFALGRNPDLSCIAASYSAGLADLMNRDVQRIIDSENYREVFPETTLAGRNGKSSTGVTYLRKADLFEVVDRRGAYRSAGVCGGITGMGAHILLIDDPIKDDVEASSPVYRERVWQWYTKSAYTRLAPGGGVIVIQTRWHEDDLSGRLLRAQEDGSGDKWKVVRFPAISEQEEKHRKAGEALDPARYPVGQLLRIKGTVGTRAWEAMYQQRPTASDGGMFKRSWWRYWRRSWEESIPGLEDRIVVIPDTFDEVALSWDLSFKDTKASDFVAGGAWGRKGASKYLLDIDWRRMDFPETVRAIKAQVEKHPDAHAKFVEDKANGPAVISTLKSDIYGLIAVNPEGGKEARAAATSPQVEAGNVFLPLHAPWRDRYIEEHAGFPLGAHDDAVDQQSQLLLRWSTRGGDLDFLRDMAEQ